MKTATFNQTQFNVKFFTVLSLTDEMIDDNIVVIDISRL